MYTGMNYPLFCIQSLCTCILNWFIMDMKQLPKILLRHLDHDKKASTKKISKSCPTSQKGSIWEAVNSWKIFAPHSLQFGWAETVRNLKLWNVKSIQNDFLQHTHSCDSKRNSSQKENIPYCGTLFRNICILMCMRELQEIEVKLMPPLEEW